MADVLIASDVDSVVAEVKSALSGPEHQVRVVRAGADVRGQVEQQTPDLAIFDLQIGNMGGIAACLDLHLEESGGRLPHVPVLLMLDREADVFLAQTSDAEGWIVKPLDAFRLRKAITALLAGGTFHENQAAGVS